MDGTRGMIHDDPEFRALRRYAETMGADPSLVQAAGGNVSLKRGGVLWVKASGTWLANAGRQDIFVPVRLDPLLAAMHADDAEDATRFVVAEANPSGLRPSIETTLHGVLPHPVVLHVHCVETIAWASRGDSPTAIAPLLAGLRWVFVPYVRPGAPLTRALLDVIAPDTEIAVLGNHGLVVGGADTATAGALVAEVARRLHRPPRSAPAPDPSMLTRIAAGTEFSPVADPAAHGTATDPKSLAVARLGSLYPDHVIFLGPGIATEPPRPGALWAVPGAGVLLHETATPGAHALARCLADVCARLDPTEPLVTLTQPQEAELMGWDAEKYRQALNAR
jgi:rhamnose utilization protein RhaD (predicted bifunctional aldolase and dehydrogenase)